jgi:hypothetical protein
MIEHEFYQWLGKDSNDVPYYLHLLNLVWSPDGMEHDLQVYRSVAAHLRKEPEFWSTILRGASGWRATLVGCGCLLISRERKYFGELRECFEHGNMVQPQVAVTLGLLHSDECMRAFVELLNSQDFCRSARAVVSAQRVLERLGVLMESDVQLTNWVGIEQDNAALANQVVIKHWNFWASLMRQL